MGIFTPDVKDLRELYELMLEKALSSEEQILKEGLPGMIKASTNPDLAAALQSHLEETRMHVSRLERLLDRLEGEENETKCKVTAALISDANSAAKDAVNANLRDVVLIAAGNQVEHHEISVYGTLKRFAEILGEFDDAETLNRTLEEEKKANELLTELAQKVNAGAPVAA
jgi:ferritin-like metal-binding protein YciE